MKKLTISSVVIVWMILYPFMIMHAQPVFTASAFSPQNNDQYTVGHSGTYCPGNTGANQNWNFSAVNVSTTETYTVVPSSLVPCGNQFPAANQAIGYAGHYDMLSLSASEYLSHGYSITPGMPGYIYSDPDKIFEFPMNYGSSFMDIYQGQDYNTPTYRTGNVTVTYEGYGTITTPYGSYPNAICIHRHFTESDTTSNGGSFCTADYYYWFVSGYRYPVTKSWNVGGAACGGLSNGTLFLQSITIGQAELYSDDFRMQTFPNPFSSEFKLILPNAKEGDVLTICDLMSRVVYTFQIKDEETKIDLSGLEDGIYFIKLNNGSGKKIIKAAQ